MAQLSTLGVIERMSPKIKFAIMALVFLVGVSAVGFYFYVRAHTVDQAEDRRRWLREIDAENAKSGFVKDTNGALIYVGTNQVIVK